MMILGISGAVTQGSFLESCCIYYITFEQENTVSKYLSSLGLNCRCQITHALTHAYLKMQDNMFGCGEGTNIENVESDLLSALSFAVWFWGPVNFCTLLI